MKSFLAKLTTAALSLATLLITGSAWAATPVAVWDGDFSNLTSGMFTLDLNSGSYGDDVKSNIVVGSNGGILLTAAAETADGFNINAFSGKNITVIVKLSDYTYSVATPIISIVGSQDTRGEGDRYEWGIASSANDDCKGIWYQHSGNPNISYANTQSVTKIFGDGNTHTMAVAYGSGTYGYVDGTQIYANSGLNSTKLTPYGVAIGGLYKQKGNVAIAAGMKISAIAIFDSKLTDSEIAAFKFASEMTEYVGTFGQNVTNLSDSNISWTSGGEAVNYSDFSDKLATSRIVLKNTANATFTGNAATTVGKLIFDATGTLTFTASTAITSSLGYEINSGIVKMGAWNSYGQANNVLTVNAGATLDNNGQNAGSAGYRLILNGGTYSNSVNAQNYGKTKPVTMLCLTADSKITATQQFGLVNGNWGATYLNLNGYTLTKDGSADFQLENTTIGGTGKLVLSAGSFSSQASGKKFDMLNATLEWRGGATFSPSVKTTIDTLELVPGNSVLAVGNANLWCSKITATISNSQKWLVFGANNTTTVAFSGTPEFTVNATTANNSNYAMILDHSANANPLVVKNLSGNAYVRDDYGTNLNENRYIDTLQTKDTTYAGSFTQAGATSRHCALRVRGETDATSFKSLTLTANSTTTGPLEILTKGKVVFADNGAWAGTVSVDGTSCLEARKSITFSSLALEADATLVPNGGVITATALTLPEEGVITIDAANIDPHVDVEILSASNLDADKFVISGAPSMLVVENNKLIAKSAYIEWIGGGENSNWSNSNNWNGGVVPGSGNFVEFDDTDVVNVDDNADLTGVTIQGAGTIIYDNITVVDGKWKSFPTAPAGLTASEWTGTVVFKNYQDSTTGNRDFINFINADSTVEFENVKGWFNSNKDNPGTVRLTKGTSGNAALEICNGASGFDDSHKNVFAKLVGDGKLYASWGNNFPLLIKDAIGFTGSIETVNNGIGIVIGSDAAHNSPNAAKARIVVNSGAFATIDENETWTAASGIFVNGTITGAGTLASATTFGEGATIKPTKGGLKFNAAVTGEPIIDCLDAIQDGVCEGTLATFTGSVPTYTVINNGSVLVFTEGLSVKFRNYAARWGYANNVFNWRTPTSQGNFHQGTWSSFNLETGEETEHTQAWRAEFGDGNGGASPCNVMRYDTATYRQSSDASFNPLTFGGLIVETGATGYGVTGTKGSSDRPTYLGDTSGTKESYFLFNESWTINREGATTIYGPANVEVASGKIFDCDSSKTSYNTVLATGKNTVLKLHGEGTMKVAKLVATGDVAIDFSDLKDRVNTAPFITGNVQIDATTKLYFPEGFAEDSDFVLCSGLVDGPSTLETTIYVGGEAKSVVLSVNGNKLRYFTPVNTTWVGGESGNWNDENSWNYGVPDNHSIATVNDAATIALPAEVSGGVLKLNAAVKFTAASGSATLDVGLLVKDDAVAVTLGAGVTYTLKETAIPAGFKFEAGGKIAGVAVPALSGATITVAGEVANGAYTILEWTDLMAKNSQGYGAPTLSLETADENVRLLCLSDRVVLQKIDPTTPVTKVWCVGDSITEGYNGQNSSANYRTQLAAELSILGYNPKMVGDIDVQGYMPSGAEAPEEWRRHSGHSAQRIWTRNVNGGSNSRAGYLEAIDAAMYQVGDDVDVITVKLGTNDLLSGNGGDTVDHAFEGLQLLIDKIVDGMPHARIVVATIIPSTGGGNGNFAPYNTKIKDWLNTKPYGEQVVCADLYTSLTTAATERGIAASELTVDGTHPTWSGDGFLAKTLSAAVDGVLKNAYTPTKPTRITESMGAASNTEIAGYREGFTHYASLAIPEKATYALNATMSDVGYTDVAEEVPAKIGKVAYYLELARAREDGTLDVRYVWADMDAISENVSDLLVPVAGTQNGVVTRLHVKSNMGSVTTIEPDENTVNGYVEFTPYTATANAVSTGPTALWPCMDWNDTLPTTGDVGGRGSMQIHRINDADSHNGGEVIFAWNNWGAANNPDVMTLTNKEDARYGEIGIGNFAQHYMTDTSRGRCTGSLINAKFGNGTIAINNDNNSADYNSLRFSPWGDAMNAKAYTVRNLEIWVQEKFDDLAWTGNSGTWTATSFNGQDIYTKEGAHAVEFADNGEATEELAITVDGNRSVTRMVISAKNRAVSFTSGSVEATSLVKAADTLELTINNGITVVGDAEFNGEKVSVNGELTVNGNAAFNCGELAIAKDAVVFVKGATSGTAKITGTGRLVISGSHLPASTLTGLTDSTTWTGTVEFRDFEPMEDSNRIIKFMEYANTASTISLNNVNATMFGGNPTYPHQTFGYLEIAEGGWVQPVHLTYGNSPDYTCSLIGTGTLSVMQGNGNNSVTFIGDHSKFSGSVDMASTTSKRLILKGASATTVASAFAARQVVIASDTTINTAEDSTWTAPGGISVEGTLAGAGTMDGALTLKSGATIDLTGFATELDASAKLIGNFTAATGVIYKFPAGYDENTPFVLCGGTLSPSEDKNATIYVGDGEAMSVTLVFDAATKSVKYFKNGAITLTGTVNVSTINQLGTGNVIATFGENATIVMDADVVAKGITITGGAGKTLTLTDTWNGTTGYKATLEGIAKFILASDFAGKMINNTTCVSGAVCYYDWTFTNTVQTTGNKNIATSAYSRKQATLQGDLNTNYADQNEEGLYTSLYISVRPYLNLDWNNIGKPMTIALACKMSEYPNTELIALGNQSKCFFFATTDLPNEVQLVYGTQTTDNQHHDCEIITTMSVPAASTMFHVYEITLSADGKTVTVYLDGIEWASSYKEDGFGMNNGLQLGGWFQGNYKNDGYSRDGDNANETADGVARTDTTKVGRVKMLRVYDSTLGPKAMEALSDEFPYNPQYGAYSRTLDETTEDWSATGAWTDDDDQPADAPVNGSVANLTVGVNSELTVNAGAEIHQESVSIVGQNDEGQTLRIKADAGEIINDGATVITTPVTIEYGAMTIAGGPTRINGKGSVTFDFSNYPMDTVYGEGHIGLTGLCDAPESEDPATWPVKLIVPTDLKGRTMTLGYTGNNKYELVYGIERPAATTLYLTTSGEITDDTLFATSAEGTADTLRLYADDIVVIPSGIVATVPETGLHFPLAHFKGAGTVVFDGYLPNDAIKGQLQAETWTGTAWIKNITTTPGNGWYFPNYGSKVKVTNVKGWFFYTTSFQSVDVELADGDGVNALEFTDGSGNKVYGFTSISGNGTLKTSSVNADAFVVKVEDVSNFNGKLISASAGDGTIAIPIYVGTGTPAYGTTSKITFADGVTVKADLGWEAESVAFGNTIKIVDASAGQTLVSGVTAAPASGYPKVLDANGTALPYCLTFENNAIKLVNAGAKIGTVFYLTLNDAINAVQDGEEILVLSTIANATVEIPEGKNVIIGMENDIPAFSGAFVKAGVGALTMRGQFKTGDSTTVTVNEGTLVVSDANIASYGRPTFVAKDAVFEFNTEKTGEDAYMEVYAPFAGTSTGVGTVRKAGAGSIFVFDADIKGTECVFNNFNGVIDVAAGLMLNYNVKMTINNKVNVAAGAALRTQGGNLITVDGATIKLAQDSVFVIGGVLFKQGTLNLDLTSLETLKNAYPLVSWNGAAVTDVTPIWPVAGAAELVAIHEPTYGDWLTIHVAQQKDVVEIPNDDPSKPATKVVVEDEFVQALADVPGETPAAKLTAKPSETAPFSYIEGYALGLNVEQIESATKPFLKVVTEGTAAAATGTITFNFYVGNAGKVTPRMGVGKTAKFSVQTATSPNAAAADWKTDGEATTENAVEVELPTTGDKVRYYRPKFSFE